HILSKFHADAVKNFLEAAWGTRDPAKTAGQVLATAVVPSAVNQLAKTIDPTAREANTPGAIIQSRIPGLRSDLPAKYDYRGREMEAPARFFGQAKQADAIDRTADKLNLSVPGIPQKINVRGRSLDLTPQEHSQYSKLAGQYVNDRLGDVDLA